MTLTQRDLSSLESLAPPPTIEGDFMRWVTAIDLWTTWMIASGLRRRTIELRRYQMRRVAEAHLRRSPWRVRNGDLVDWLAEQPWAPETRKSYRLALRGFYRWAHANGYTRTDPSADLPPVPTPTAIPRPCPDNVLDDAITHATDRDRLILMLAAFAGLRRNEIATLRWQDIGISHIRIRGKGGKVRPVPLHPALASEIVIERAKRDCGSHGTGYRYTDGIDGPWLFPGQSGGHLSADAVGKIAGRLLEPGWSLHPLRARFATRAYAGTRDVFAVQRLLGHAKPETTVRYVQVADETLTEAVRSV